MAYEVISTGSMTTYCQLIGQHQAANPPSMALMLDGKYFPKKIPPWIFWGIAELQAILQAANPPSVALMLDGKYAKKNPSVVLLAWWQAPPPPHPAVRSLRGSQSAQNKSTFANTVPRCSN